MGCWEDVAIVAAVFTYYASQNVTIYDRGAADGSHHRSHRPASPRNNAIGVNSGKSGCVGIIVLSPVKAVPA